MKKINIKNKVISDQNYPFFVAEAGINYDGNFQKCFKLIDAAKASGADAIKFQTHIAEEEMIDTKIMLAHSKKETVYDLMKKCELDLKRHKILKKYCDKRKIIFMSTPFSYMAAKLLNSLKLQVFKIGSGECNNFPLIEKVAKFKKPTIISTGMNSINSIKETVNHFKKYNQKLILMHCVSMYPTPPSKTMLDTIPLLKKKFNCPVGFSDHSNDINLAIASVSLGANIIEKHFTVSKNWSGPDIEISITPDKFMKMVNACREVYLAKGTRDKILKEEIPVTKFAFASVVTLKDIKKGEKLSEKNIWVKRPGTGQISAKNFYKILNKKSKKNLKANVQLKFSDINT